MHERTSIISLIFNFNYESHSKRKNLGMVYPPLIFTIKKKTPPSQFKQIKHAIWKYNLVHMKAIYT